MATYTTLDYLPDLTSSEMNNAGTLTFTRSSPNSVGWDNSASVSGSESYALLHDTYRFVAKAGATYDIYSVSYFDPYLLRIYDSAGNTVVANDESDDPIGGFRLSDGSYDADVINDWVAPYSGTFYVAANWNQGSYYKFYYLSLDENIDTIPATELGKTLIGSSSNDSFIGGNGNDNFDGGAGTDTVMFNGNRSSHTLTKTVTGWTVSSSFGGTDSLQNVERIKFSDTTVALDIAGNGGQAYRVYQAAFNRTPDSGGLGFWINTMDGGASLRSVAEGFVGSAEFKALYGTNPTNAQIVTKLYDNVLHRPGETGGFNFWLGVLDSKADTLAGVLAAFSESPENQAGLVGVIGNGFAYTPFA